MENSKSSNNKKGILDPTPPPRITLELGRWIVDTDEVELNADQDEFDLEVEAARPQSTNELEEPSTSYTPAQHQLDDQQPSTSYASASRERKNEHNGRTYKNKRLEKDEHHERHERRDEEEKENVSREEKRDRYDRKEKEGSKDRRDRHDSDSNDSSSPDRRVRSRSSERSRRSPRKRGASSSSSTSSPSTSTLSQSSSSTESDSDKPYFVDSKREKDRLKKLRKSKKQLHRENRAKRWKERRCERRHYSPGGRETDRSRRSPEPSIQRRDRPEPINAPPSTFFGQPNSQTQIIILPYGHDPFMPPGVLPPFLRPQNRPIMHGPGGFNGPPMQMQPPFRMPGPMGPYPRPYMMPPQGRFPHPGFRRQVRPKFWRKKKNLKKRQQDQDPKPDSNK